MPKYRLKADKKHGHMKPGEVIELSEADASRWLHKFDKVADSTPTSAPSENIVKTKETDIPAVTTATKADVKK